VEDVDHGQVDSAEHLLARARAEGAHEVEEPVAQEEGAGVRHPDAVLEVNVILKNIFAKQLEEKLFDLDSNYSYL
jgi:hypothetical protein